MSDTDSTNPFRADLIQEAAEQLTGERDRLLHALKVILPMAKGFAVEHPVGNNMQLVLWAECIAENPSRTLK